MGLGAGAGGAEALFAIIQQKLAQERLQMAQRAQASQEDRQRGDDAYRQEDLSLRRRSADRADASAKLLDQQRQAGLDAKQAEQETAGHQATLRASIQGSQNLAGSSDPRGATATRNALRVALTSSGAKDSDIPQEPKQEKPAAPVRPMNVSPGARLVDPTTGKVIFAAPERPQRITAAGGTPTAQAQQAQSPEQKEQNEVQDSLALIKQIRDDASRATATGPIQGRGLGMLQDLEGVTRVQALHDNLVNKLQLAQAGKLKGQGQISNFERDMLSKAATALQLKLGDDDFLNELAKVEAQFQRMLTGPRAVNAPPAASDGASETPEQRIKRLLGGG